jgi:hypothetical protein
VNDADLAALVEAWPTLPAVIKAGILAMVRAVRGILLFMPNPRPWRSGDNC